MTQPMAFVLCVLGSKAILDVWFEGSIFAYYRAWAELFRDEGKWWVTRKFGELLSCRFCFSYHSSLWLTLLCLPILPWWSVIPWWLAVRATTGFLDTLESLTDKTEDEHVRDAAGPEDPDPLRGSDQGGLFD